MNKLLSRGLALLILLSSCASQNATTELTPGAWRDDLRYLARELPSRHINAFPNSGFRISYSTQYHIGSAPKLIPPSFPIGISSQRGPSSVPPAIR